MSLKFRIAVLGIGGVGGYFGGKLAKHYYESDNVEVVFIARGGNAKAIKENGLKIITLDDEQIAIPNLITNEPTEIGKIDLFLICTKAYDLTESINRFKACIGEKTTILPLLNGVNHAETIKQILPNADVWNGCAFIVSRLSEPGIITVTSEIKLLQFGNKTGDFTKLKLVENHFSSAGIDAVVSDNIDKTIWEKFIFISSLATLTSALDKTIGEILSSAENTLILTDLIAEVTQLARAKKINVAENIEELTLEKIRNAPPNATSSMHADFAKKGKTELETLTGFVVNESSIFDLNTPYYTWLYGHLSGRK